MLPNVQGSDFAREVDLIYMGIFWLSVVLFIGITFATLYFSWRYRYKPGRVTPHTTHNTTLEILWSVLPLLLCVLLFFVGFKGYMDFAVAPGDALEIQVTAKKWLWQFEYPDGTRSVNELHLPVGQTVRFVMTSEDVLHDFYLPDFRIKRDVIPGRYSQIWMKSNESALGEHVSTCAEYCGKGHSDMRARVFIDTKTKFDEWMATGGDEWKNHPPEEWGKIQWEQKGCNACHTIDGANSKGPTWKGIYGTMVELNNGQKVMIDENYLKESMFMPNAKVVKGFEPVMPTFQGLLRENEVNGLIAFIKSLK
jgi:cytochrome c oxidase subunit 2